MTPKETAKKLYKDMFRITESQYESKQCALIAVDELIECTPSVDIYPFNCQEIKPRVREYWIKVKEEIEKL